MGVKTKVKRTLRRYAGTAVGRKAVGGLGGIRLPSFGARPKVRKVRRTRGMYMRKGRLFLGYAQKEIKNAMRRAYGGGRRRVK